MFRADEPCRGSAAFRIPVAALARRDRGRRVLVVRRAVGDVLKRLDVASRDDGRTIAAIQVTALRPLLSARSPRTPPQGRRDGRRDAVATAGSAP
ncbi:hypothetical protein ACIQ9P_22580 [Kitasatospora sp. NPDC094019]|uniref:hypothetical protein n=1 Tax=Kitasatospora sp. NPDC094019 TaxID=3364091 RepID=UPI003800117D